MGCAGWVTGSAGKHTATRCFTCWRGTSSILSLLVSQNNCQQKAHTQRCSDSAQSTAIWDSQWCQHPQLLLLEAHGLSIGHSPHPFSQHMGITFEITGSCVFCRLLVSCFQEEDLISNKFQLCHIHIKPFGTNPHSCNSLWPVLAVVG